MRNIIWILFLTGILTFSAPISFVSGVNIDISDIIFLLAFFLVLIENTFLRNILIPIFSQKYWFIWVIILFLGTGTLLSALFSDSPVTATTNFIQYIYIFIVLLTLIEYLINSKLRNAAIICLLTLIPGIVVSTLVLLSFFNIFNGLDSIILSPNGRYVGFEGIATEFGSQMGLYLTISIFGFLYYQKKIYKFFFICISIAFVFVSSLSGSFGAGLILYSTVFLFLIYGFKGKILPKIIAISSLIFLVYQYYLITVERDYRILRFLPDIMQERFTAFGNNFGSLEERININIVALKDFLQSPLIGFGYGEYQFNNDFQISVHNTFLSAAVELGILGFIGVILYIFLPIIMAFILYFKYDFKQKALVVFLGVYSMVRLINAFKAQEFIDREPWIPILVIFVFFASRKNLIKN